MILQARTNIDLIHNLRDCHESLCNFYEIPVALDLVEQDGEQDIRHLCLCGFIVKGDSIRKAPIATLQDEYEAVDDVSYKVYRSAIYNQKKENFFYFFEQPCFSANILEEGKAELMAKIHEAIEDLYRIKVDSIVYPIEWPKENRMPAADGLQPVDISAWDGFKPMPMEHEDDEPDVVRLCF